LANNISDIIEQHLKAVIRASQAGVIELQRSELAELFQCVPSQINYVISTRFSIEQGYIVESKRGGRGYIRIRQLSLDALEPIVQLIQSFHASISQHEAEGLIDRLVRDEWITPREFKLMRSVVAREVLAFDIPVRDQLRARLMTVMLTAILAYEP